MKFSIVMASLLESYPNAAKNREKKILRAINSVQQQTFRDFEIIVVADGCQRTMNLVEDTGVKSFLIPRSRLWTGGPRNKGIEEAQGEYIVYLDIDDVFGENHLKGIAEGLANYDWVWFNDIRYAPKQGIWYENPCDIIKIGRHGTSNICHKKMNVKWDHPGYAHDYYFVQKLRQNTNYAKIECGEYYVCHIPGREGYDL
jgi:glycosyltransferase involved in cell wall biosynthesis